MSGIAVNFLSARRALPDPAERQTIFGSEESVNEFDVVIRRK